MVDNTDVEAEAAQAELEVQAFFEDARAGDSTPGPKTAEEWGVRDYSKTQRTNMDDAELVKLKAALEADEFFSPL